MDGVAASNYVDLLGSEAKMHRTIATCRLLARFAPRFIHWLHARELNMPAVLYMGRVLPEVSSDPCGCICLTVTPALADHAMTTAATGAARSGLRSGFKAVLRQTLDMLQKTSLHCCRWLRAERPGRGCSAHTGESCTG